MSMDTVLKILKQSKKESLKYCLFCDGCVHYEKESVLLQSVNCLFCLRNKKVKDKYRKEDTVLTKR